MLVMRMDGWRVYMSNSTNLGNDVSNADVVLPQECQRTRYTVKQGTQLHRCWHIISPWTVDYRLLGTHLGVHRLHCQTEKYTYNVKYNFTSYYFHCKEMFHLNQMGLLPYSYFIWQGKGSI